MGGSLGVSGRAPLLELVGVRAGYGSIAVLHGIDLALPEGAVVALLGPNGSGKSTTLKVCAGLLPVTSGEVLVGGRRVNGVAADVLARAGICTIPEGRGVFPNLTVRDNLRMVTCSGVPLKRVEEVAYSRFQRLGERRYQLAGTLSGGEQQMCAIGRALLARPRLLLLDEPSMGLAPVLVERIFDVIVDINKQGTTVLLVEQNAAMALEIADRGYVLETGRVALSDDAEALRSNERVRASYLGE
jgi:branched-chain amino acid transport system ATP-binding protein